MRNFWVLVAVCLVVQLYGYGGQAHPHRSIEETEEDVDTDEDTSSDAEHRMVPASPEPDSEPEPEQPQAEPQPEPQGESSNVREMTGQSHEGDSNEEERNTGVDPDPDTESNEEEQRNTSTSDEDDSLEFPRTEALCPARPEEITLVEQECAKEYQQWKESKAKKEMTQTTTFTPQVLMDITSKPSQADEPLSEAMKMMSTEEPLTTTEEATAAATTTTDMTTMTTTDDDTMTTNTETETTTMEATTARTMMTTAAPSTDVTEKSMGRRKRMVVKRKRSCYPATCILRKLKLLDSMSQLNSKQIQKFAMNMTAYSSSNLEEKAMECVKEINDAMIDNSSDIGKKVGCVAYKVITCLNKGLACPIIKVPQN